MPAPSIAMTMYLEAFKAAASEGAAVELKLRLLAGSIPALQVYALKQRLEDVETPVISYFARSLSDQEAETLRLCRQLRNKVLHTDFQAARDKLNEMGIKTTSGEVKKVAVPVISVAAISEKICVVQVAMDGTIVAKRLTEK